MWSKGLYNTDSLVVPKKGTIFFNFYWPGRLKFHYPPPSCVLMGEHHWMEQKSLKPTFLKGALPPVWRVARVNQSNLV